MTQRREWQRGIRTDVPVVVMKLTADRLQHGSLGIARSLGRLGIPVYFATVDGRTPALRSRYSRGQPIGLHPGGPPVLESLLAVARQLGGTPVLVAADDVAALFVDEHLETLRDAFRLPAQPGGLPRELSNKGALHRLCEASNVPSPAARFPTSLAEFLRDAADLGYPVVAKSMDPVVMRRGGGGPSVSILHSPDHARRAYASVESAGEQNLMLQEHIPGDARSIWMFNGYFDQRGRCAFGVVGQKVRQSPPDTGATSLGVTVHNEEVERLATSFLGGLGYRGIVDLGFRRDDRDGRYKLLDVNPRIGSTFRLFVGRNGLDVVRASYLDLTGQAIPASTTRLGRRWLVEDQDLSTALRLARGRRLGLGAYLRSLRGVEETAWLARDDLWPVVDMVSATVARLGRRRRQAD